MQVVRLAAAMLIFFIVCIILLLVYLLCRCLHPPPHPSLPHPA